MKEPQTLRKTKTMSVKQAILRLFKKNRQEHKELDKELISPNNIISFRAGYDLTQLPIVTLYQGDKVLNFLLDTGSNDSIIDSNVLKDIEHTMSDEKSSLYGLEGNAQEVGKCSITLSYQGLDYPYEYIVCDMTGPFSKIKAESGVILHGLIGSKFFNTYKYVLDFESLIAYSKK